MDENDRNWWVCVGIRLDPTSTSSCQLLLGVTLRTLPTVFSQAPTACAKLFCCSRFVSCLCCLIPIPALATPYGVLARDVPTKLGHRTLVISSLNSKSSNVNTEKTGT